MSSFSFGKTLSALGISIGLAMTSTLAHAGARQIIFNAFASTLDEGDEVLVPVPYWPSFPDIVRVNGGEPVFIECGLEQGCKLTPRQLEQHINQRTRWLILSSRGNPGGAVYSEAKLLALAEVEHGVAGVAGSAYGLSAWFRLSIATATSSVIEAGRRIADACAQRRVEASA